MRRDEYETRVQVKGSTRTRRLHADPRRNLYGVGRCLLRGALVKSLLSSILVDPIMGVMR